MDESLLVKLSLAVSVIGIIGLYFTSAYSSLPDFNSSSIDSYVGQDVVVSGAVDKIYAGEKSERIILKELKYGGTIPVIVFRQESENISIAEGGHVMVTGEIRKYNGDYEIVAYSIKNLGS